MRVGCYCSGSETKAMMGWECGKNVGEYIQNLVGESSSKTPTLKVEKPMGEQG